MTLLRQSGTCLGKNGTSGLVDKLVKTFDRDALRMKAAVEVLDICMLSLVILVFLVGHKFLFLLP